WASCSRWARRWACWAASWRCEGSCAYDSARPWSWSWSWSRSRSRSSFSPEARLTPPLLLLLLFSASPQELRAEQADVTERLDAERAALQSLQSSKVEVLTVVDLFERLTRASQARSMELARTAVALDSRIVALRMEAEAARLEVLERQQT